jgi:CMP-N,N'-diacetyllegionaminic acid synthase
MNILITICGRAGSECLKGKNLKEFIGYPLILYTLSASFLFRKYLSHYNIDIVVNSDSLKLLEIVKKTEICNIIERPTELAQSTTPKINVIKHSLNFMEKKYNKKYNFIIDLDITSPLRTIEDIISSLDKIVSNEGCDVLFSVVHSRRNPYFNMVEIKNGFVYRSKVSSYVARQQAPQVLDMNASIYVFRRDSLINKLKTTVFDGNCCIYCMRETYVLDIDSEEDFKIMELLAKEYFFKFDAYNLVRETIPQIYNNA